MRKKKRVRLKPVDLGYCFKCANFIGGFERGNDFCRYDGRMLVQAESVKFIFVCAQFKLNPVCRYNFI